MYKIETSMLISITSTEHQSKQGSIAKIASGLVNEKGGLYLISYLKVQREHYITHVNSC
jgi:hypothetical protein